MKKEKKEVLIFLAVAYGLPFLMAIPMAILFRQGKDVGSFPAAQMFYPAAGVMLAKLICEKGSPLLPKKFFIGFLILTAYMVLQCFNGFLPGNLALPNLAMIGAIVLMFFFFAEKKEPIHAHGLNGNRWKLSGLLLLLFTALYLVRLFAGTIYGGSLSDLLRNFSPGYLPLILLGMFNLFTYFLGEEYGWRYYLQPRLQNKFGPIKGVLLLGVAWEFWHLPLVLLLYAPELRGVTLVQFMLLRYANCIALSIFMAYAYLRTYNVWVPVIIHFLNNNLLALFYQENATTVPAGTEYTWVQVVVTILIQVVLYGPFLFSKVFRRPMETTVLPIHGRDIPIGLLNHILKETGLK